MRLELTPTEVSAGCKVVVRVPAGADPAPQAAVLGFTDDVTTGWWGEVGLQPGDDGTLAGEVEVGLDRVTVGYVSAVRLPDGSSVEAESNLVAINPERPGTDPVALREELLKAQEDRFEQPLGDRNKAGALEHRVLCVVERLLITTPLRVPGVQVLPINARPEGLEELELLTAVIKDLAWGDELPRDFWVERSRHNRPWIAIVSNQVWARDFEEAARLAWDQRGRLLAIFGLTRGARGRPVATFVQQRQADDSIKYRLFHEDEPYAGNLIGGFVSGEDVHDLLTRMAALENDPLLEVLVDLYSEALADRSADARYLRWWSVLETLAGARIPPNQPVTLENGDPFPDGGNTAHAAPRVYELLKNSLDGINIESVVQPASDLYEAVQAWYARRNATGHYGRFDPADSRQQQRAWMKWAALTEYEQGLSDPWLRALQSVLETTLGRELHAAGRPHV